MNVVTNWDDLGRSIATLEKYLSDKKDPEYGFALGLIQKGTCFVAIESDQGYKFYPSRFIGYSGNTMSDHLAFDKKDGGITNLAISRILGAKPAPNAELNAEYAMYCERLGITAREKGTCGVERKFWVGK